MTVRRFMVPAAIAATLTVLAPPAEASLIRATVPFSFMVNDRAFAPGSCAVSAAGSLQGFVLVRSTVTGAFAMITPLRAAKEAEPKLVFHKYGDEYVLRQIWWGYGMGFELPEPAVERQLRERTRSTNGTLGFERVVVLAR